MVSTPDSQEFEMIGKTQAVLLVALCTASVGHTVTAQAQSVDFKGKQITVADVTQFRIKILIHGASFFAITTS